MTPEEIAATAARIVKSYRGTKLVDAEVTPFRFGSSGKVIRPPGFSAPPAFNHSPLGEDGYSLRRVVQALATGNPSEAAFEMALSQKLQAAGFPCGPKSFLIPIPGCLWYPAGHEALVKSVETEFSESFPSSTVPDLVEIRKLQQTAGFKAMDP